MNMSRIGCNRVSFSSDQEESNQEPIYSSRHGRRRVFVGRLYSFGVRSSPSARRLLQHIRTRVTKTLRFFSLRRKSTTNTKSSPASRNICSCSSLFFSSSSNSSLSSIYMVKSKSVNETESHRAEAIEDCIEFLKSSSSLFRSNSISTWSC